VCLKCIVGNNVIMVVGLSTSVCSQNKN